MGRGPRGKTLIDRFWQKVFIIPGGCWLWIGSGRRYGHFRVGYKTTTASRFSYEYFKGSLDDGFEVDHLCKWTYCVNPEHLEGVTRKINCERRDNSQCGAHHRNKTHCKRGHAFVEGSFYKRKNGRHCKACERINHVNWYHRNKKHERTII